METETPCAWQIRAPSNKHLKLPWLTRSLSAIR